MCCEPIAYCLDYFLSVHTSSTSKDVDAVEVHNLALLLKNHTLVTVTLHPQLKAHS